MFQLGVKVEPDVLNAIRFEPRHFGIRMFLVHVQDGCQDCIQGTAEATLIAMFIDQIQKDQGGMFSMTIDSQCRNVVGSLVGNVLSEGPSLRKRVRAYTNPRPVGFNVGGTAPTEWNTSPCLDMTGDRP